MSYLIDTDWIIDYLNGYRRAVDLFGVLAVEPLAISLIAYGEVYEGIYYGRKAATSEVAFLQLLRVVHVLDLNQDILRRFGRVRGALRNRGQGIGDSDLLIGATALHYGLVLVTRNVEHFRRIPGLMLYERS